LAEIATICALENNITITAVVDARSTQKSFVGVPVLGSMDEIGDRADCVVVTDLKTAQETSKAAIEMFGASCVLVPALLGVRVHKDSGAAK